ncbi:Vps52-domain-containing protein [Aspergillus eucalypticola CBS 122712]|uniref:Vps52-domain-containing protein n=1 Tax=Aspergillus eucalypticola (strain CBS 122712 / IBT 29274) TaxID=1448314 RepID=A0A317WMC4_ASPEC|nr:Vps52-domain-containing protein [Aspergillus eucalypticola CBS 122712]PWY85400.1 Vps52-domain-containing protein [Aspergillus eucalypticola CBS 122712]
MWLDRISGHATPSGPQFDSRSSSPLPRRTSSRLAPTPNNRPASSRQGSALSLLSTPNDSSTSLSATAREGSSPKPSATRPRPSDVADPLEVLNGIIGKQGKTRDSSPASVAEVKPSELVEDIDFHGLSLEDFIAEEEQPRRAWQSDVGAQTIQQFEKERDKFQDLHSAITGCDDVSKSVEMYLNDFQNELGAVSAEIESLQSRSILLNAMLENRRNVEQLLGPAVEEISLSPKTVRLVAEGPIDENWVKALNEIETRTASIEAKASGTNSSKSIEDVRPLLGDIKKKAVERIRDYLVSQIRALRSPNINAQIIQQQRLVKFKDLYGYISRAHPTLTGEITQAYINTMRWYYLSHFTRYHQALEKIKVYPSDRNEVLGGDPSSHKTGNIVPGGRAGSAAHDPFSLGRRVDILRAGNQMAISSYLAEEDNAFHGLEVPFRNFNLALLDNVSAEYSFMTEMFSTLGFQQISRKAVEIFEPVFTLGQALTKHLIEQTTDALGVLICVRLNQQAAFELQRRKVPVADSYVNGTNMQLWPRFQVIMDTQCESLKRVAANTGRSAVSALSLAGGDDLNKSSAPHFLTQRFGQLLHGILVLSSEAGDDEPVANSLGRLTTEFDNLLAKLSRIGGDAKRRERFLYNNYSLVLAIISDTHGKLATEQKQVRATLPVQRIELTAHCLNDPTESLNYYGHPTAASRADVTHAVIGAGVVGLAVARQLAMKEGTSTILLERHDAPGTETSSRNSEVIHAGLYYGADTLKTSLCIKGKELLYALCAQHNIPHRNTKKWIVAQTPEQWEACLRVHEHAKRIGVPTRILGQEEAQRREPEVRALAGIVESPTTGIIDSHSLMTYLQGDFEDRGGDCAFMTQVTGIEPLPASEGGGYRISAVSADGSETTITAETVINSAGNGACAINNMVMPAERHRKAYFAKGTYFSYSASTPKTSVLVYPTTLPGTGGLGTHLTLDMGGRIRFGPDVEWVEDPSDLRPSPARLQQALPEIRAYLPNVDVEAIDLDYCGIRPKLGKGGAVNTGKGFQDFVIQEEEGFPGFVNLLGIESPGLTSCLAIGERVRDILYA